MTALDIHRVLQRLPDELARRAQAAPGSVPTATYRIQFHAGFRFADAHQLVSYLHDLGITHCYASPYLKARHGSQHGYDISDHSQLNPEIGTEEEHAAWAKALEAKGMGHILDVVPNHMGIVGNQNVWWNDVLENGPSSPYASFFDIDWHPIKPDLHNKVLLPILGSPYGKVLEAGELRLHYEQGAFSVYYFEHRFPIAPDTYIHILDQNLEALEEALGEEGKDAFVEYQSIRTAVAHLPPCSVRDPEKIEERQREKEVVKRRLANLTDESEVVAQFLHQTVDRFSGVVQDGEKGTDDPHRFDLLDRLLNAQPYRLSWWRVATDEINYRRFFDINELAALSMEKQEVFEATHKLVFRLLRENQLQGLRIDHPDGLYNPHQYLERLQEWYLLQLGRNMIEQDPECLGGGGGAKPPQGPVKELAWEEVAEPLLHAIRQERSSGNNPTLARPLYVVVEKILGPDEPLPSDWPVQGTTGYEFLNAVNGLFVDRNNARAMDRLYRRWTRMETPYRDLVYRKKFLILQVSLSSELNVLAIQLDRLSEKDRWSRDFTLNNLRRALREIIACFGVYRSYITDRDLLARDRVYVERAVAQAKRRNPAISGDLFDFIRGVLLLAPISGWHPGGQTRTLAQSPTRAQLRFVGKFQQVTAPVMAKGVEDTTFYVYNRLVSLNEVGGEPVHFGMTLEQFHRQIQQRQQRTPQAMSATATHDTKRGEDTRARINVLSEVPGLWQDAVIRWSKFNRKYRVTLEEDQIVPDRNEEYFFYQTLLGAWPLETQEVELQEPLPAEFLQRIQQYMHKAMQEAKVHTSWVNQNPAFNEAIAQFVTSVLDVENNHRFVRDFRRFQRLLAHYGLFNSLSQVLLKIASPGVPDIYQGTELWDFSLVDPDNRRPVDYPLRQRYLGEIQTRVAECTGKDGALAEFARELVEQRHDGRAKLYLMNKTLTCRREHPKLFTEGSYVPAEVAGAFPEQVCAFVRELGGGGGAKGPRPSGSRALVVTPRLLVPVISTTQLPLGDVWKDTRLLLPQVSTGQRFRNVLTEEVLTAEDHEGQASLLMAEIFGHFPAALFLLEG